MNCPHCGIIIEEKWAFCPKCSNGLNSKIQSQQEKQQQYATNDLPSNYVTVTSDKELKKARNFCIASLILVLVGLFSHAYLLAIIGGGLHRFYVGKMFSGAFYSLTCGFLVIGIIFDLIQINTGQFSDNVGHPLRK